METKNPYSKSNVNVAQGPRTGNDGAHKGKRAAFKDEKADREPVAKAIMAAYAGREEDEDKGEHISKREGAIRPEVNEGKRKK